MPVAEAAAEEAAALASEMSESKIRPASTGELRLQAVQKRRQHPAVASFFHCLFAAFFRKAELRGAAAEARSAAETGEEEEEEEGEGEEEEVDDDDDVDVEAESMILDRPLLLSSSSSSSLSSAAVAPFTSAVLESAAEEEENAAIVLRRRGNGAGECSNREGAGGDRMHL